jgi:hypothetical protein
MKKEGRLLYTNFPDDWERYDLENVVIKPALMKPDELSKIVGESKALIYSEEMIEQKFKQTLNATNEVIAHMVKTFNVVYRRRLKELWSEYFIQSQCHKTSRHGLNGVVHSSGRLVQADGKIHKQRRMRQT